ncbi:MAG: hypothetical protein ACTSVO_08465, partial [Candidatus Heimdallarchaeaceae archaeon]
MISIQEQFVKCINDLEKLNMMEIKNIIDHNHPEYEKYHRIIDEIFSLETEATDMILQELNNENEIIVYSMVILLGRKKVINYLPHYFKLFNNKSTEVEEAVIFNLCSYDQNELTPEIKD